MKAVRLTAPKHFEFIDIEQPQAIDGQCLVKLEKVSVCGSDIRHHYGPIKEESAYPMDPGLPCHELAGVVLESRTDSIKEGQRVIVIPARGTGGLQQYVVSDPSRMIVLPEQGPLDEWLMCQPSGTVLYACRKRGSVLSKNVVIFGQGSIGLSFTMIVSRLGARNVIVVDPLDYRLEKSKLFGATHTINPDKENLDDAISELTGGLGADITVEAAGYPDTLNLAFKHIKQFGTIIVFGVQADTFVPVEHNTWMNLQPTIIPTTGARSGDPIGQIQDIVALRERGWCDPAPLLTHKMGFSEVQAAYDMYEQRQDNVIKVVMDLNE